jgi:hypothetical protein
MADEFVDDSSVGRDGITSYVVYFSRGSYKEVRVRIPSGILKNKIAPSHLERVLEDTIVGELEIVPPKMALTTKHSTFDRDGGV